MGKRREGREAAVQFLYQFDVNRQPVNELLVAFWKLRSGPEKADVSAKTKTFTEELVKGVTAHMTDIDALISKFTANYDLSRIAIVDRNILRVGIYEMQHSTDVPPVVCINEAIEIAKKFGSDQSGTFVNGVLDGARRGLEAARPAS